ncbi:MAG: DUF559 domain-containing protein [Leptolyngbyaceae cyanobacterium]
MSTARHHAEWLSLVEASGPFLSLPVLLKAFPAGVDAHDPEHLKRLRSAYEEWQDNQFGLKPEPAIHRAWVEFVLKQTLELPDEVLRSGQEIPPGLSVTEQHETLRPDWAVVNPAETPDAGKPRLLVQIVPPGQGLEKPLKGSRSAASPATRMMELLHACNVRLGLVTNGEHWMLVNAPKGETTGFISWYSTLWVEEHLTLRAFRSLLGVRRFFGVDDSETLEALLTQSLTDQQEVTDQLGYQVRRAVEVLVQAISLWERSANARTDKIDLLKDIAESQLYEAALTVMMRLVFLFCAEERGLLLLGDPIYDQHYAVSTLREQLRSHADQHGEEVLERRSDAWCRLLATFRAVYGGIFHDTLQLPAYGGSLFDPDRFPFLEGRGQGTEWKSNEADPLRINNRIVLHLLEALQILQIRVPGGGVEPRRLSFQELGIEQIGHVYEGLLDHTAVRATSTVLGLVGTRYEEPEVRLKELERVQVQGEAALLAWLKEKTGRWRSLPAGKSPSALKKALSAEIEPRDQQRLRTACNNDPQLFDRVLPFAGLIRQDTLGYPVVILEGSVYVTEGVDRRQTGTHYTPRNLTEEIVQYTLEPLVFEGVAEGKPKEQWRLRSAAELLQLKICDMAMGSGAFLVQTCRYLAGKLVEAWAAEIPPHPPAPSPTGGEGEPDKWEVPEALKEKMLEVAREFRKQPTSSEEILWQALRSRKLDDRKFRRQQPIGSFVVDFFCASERLIVEVDGGIHETQQDLDRQRQELLESLGLRFVRVSSELVETNLPTALEMIRKAFAPHPLTPSPTRGEGEQETGLAPLALYGRGVGGEGDKGVGSDNRIRILPDGSLAIGAVSEHILPTDLEERLLVARRIVADRCLYGVDKNPLAVEMAKLSLWLVTLAKGRPFTFLDHALKWGDSLLGITRAEQIEYLHLNPDSEAVQYPIASQIWQPILQDAIAKRRKLESFSVNGIEDLQEKERLFQEAERAIDRLRFVGDYLIGRMLVDAGKTSDLTTEDLMVVSQRIEQELAGKATEEQTRDITALKVSAERMLNLGNPANQPPRKPFHWLLEFPEVFLEGETKGFAAIVGNPPFMHGQKITGTSGADYRDFLVEQIASARRGTADLCAYFFLRAYQLLNGTGTYGLIATNTIAQGDTREVGLDQLTDLGCVIYHAVSSKKWAGTANVEVSYIWMYCGNWNGVSVLDGKFVPGITTYLSLPNKTLGTPSQLAANQSKSFKGSDIYGMGFALSPQEAQALIDKNLANRTVLFPLLNGEDLNSHRRIF